MFSPPHRRRDHRLHVGDVEAEARRCLALDVDVDIAAAGEALGQGAAHARHVLQGPLDLAGELVDGDEVGACHLDADGALDAGGQHVDAVSDRRHPDVGESGHADDAVELLDQLVLRHAVSPRCLRLELDRRLEHLERRRVGGGFGAAGLAEHAFDFRHRLDEAVGLLQQRCCLAHRKAGKGRRHVEQVAFVEARHELGPDVLQRPQAQHEQNAGDRDRRLRCAQHRVEQRPVDSDQEAVERIRAFIGNAAANEIAHQHRDQRHREAGGRRHRVGLGEGQRREQATFLRLEREHRNEGKRDDEQREEEGRADLGRGIADHSPAGFSREAFARMGMAPLLEVLVRVLDHHHGSVDHRTDGDGDAAERHDVGVHALIAHDDERRQDAERQRDDGDERRAQVEQERRSRPPRRREIPPRACA